MGEDKKQVGFAVMTPEKRVEIARKGGKSVPSQKRTFSNNHELAKSAGRLGGQNVPADKRSFSKDFKLASAAGRKGGLSSSHKPDHGE